MKKKTFEEKYALRIIINEVKEQKFGDLTSLEKMLAVKDIIDAQSIKLRKRVNFHKTLYGMFALLALTTCVGPILIGKVSIQSLIACIGCFGMVRAYCALNDTQVQKAWKSIFQGNILKGSYENVLHTYAYAKAGFKYGALKLVISEVLYALAALRVESFWRYGIFSACCIPTVALVLAAVAGYHDTKAGGYDYELHQLQHMPLDDLDKLPIEIRSSH